MSEEEAVVTAALVIQAKSSLMRRGGVAPVQWAVGKDIRVPGSVFDDSDIGRLEVQKDLADDASATTRRDRLRATARLLKALPIKNVGLRPMDEAISTAGGIAFAAMDAGLMLRDVPGFFAAGEMLDWEAPTGGYLISACLATGRWAGQHAVEWVKAAG